LTLPLALLLDGIVLSGVQTSRILYVLTVASPGITLGVFWEIIEWAYDQMVSQNAIPGKTNTMIDPIVDAIGAVMAGLVSVEMVKAKI
jgi:hypothetical protein